MGFPFLLGPHSVRNCLDFIKTQKPTHAFAGVLEAVPVNLLVMLFKWSQGLLPHLTIAYYVKVAARRDLKLAGVNSFRFFVRMPTSTLGIVGI